VLWSAIYGLYWLTQGLFNGHWTREWQGMVTGMMVAGVLAAFGRCVNPLSGGWRRRA
jgi:hypothetical protein